MDIMPTFLELAGTAHPGTEYRGRAVLPMKGRSMLPMLRGETDRVHPPDTVTGWELFGKRAIRKGDWKLLWEPEPYGPGSWQLYDLSVDPTESDDLSGAEPETLQQMIGHWERYVEENGVILPNVVSGY
jgi:arylsulfatase